MIIFFFKDYIIFGAEIKNPSSNAPRTSEDANYVPWPKQMNLGTKLGEDFFFRDHLILETKINKSALKMSQFLMIFKDVAQTEKVRKHWTT